MIVVDTGVLYALANRRDAHHAACVRWLVGVRQPLVVPTPVVAEASYLMGRSLGAEAEASFLDARVVYLADFAGLQPQITYTVEPAGDGARLTRAVEMKTRRAQGADDADDGVMGRRAGPA